MDDFVFQGPVILLGNNIDTDQIYPGRFLDISEPSEVGRHCLEGVSPDIAARDKKGAIIVAGTNFGCGSSREHAPIALINAGISLVVAASFARIFYRNCLNLGFPLLVCPGLSDRIEDGMDIRVDVASASVWLPDGTCFSGQGIGSFALDMLRAGGMKKLYKERFSAEQDRS